MKEFGYTISWDEEMKTIKELQKEIQVEKQRIEELEKSLNKLQSKYPMELVYIGDWYCLSGLIDNNELVRKYYMFAQLVETCKEWNKIDGFEPDWKVNTETKYGIVYRMDYIKVDNVYYASSPLYFKHEETAQLFLDTFKETLEQVKDLI